MSTTTTATPGLDPMSAEATHHWLGADIVTLATYGDAPHWPARRALTVHVGPSGTQHLSIDWQQTAKPGILPVALGQQVTR